MKRITPIKVRYLANEIHDLFNICLDNALALLNDDELGRCFDDNNEIDMNQIEVKVINPNATLKILYDAATLLDKMSSIYDKERAANEN